MLNLNFVLLPHLYHKFVVSKLQPFHALAVILPLQEVVLELFDCFVLFLCILGAGLCHLFELALQTVDKSLVLGICFEDGLLECGKLLLLHFVLMAHLLVEGGEAAVRLVCGC